MNKKWVMGIALVVAAYAVYAIFFLKRIPIGDLCEETAKCNGKCMAFGGFGDNKKGEICTKSCAAASDCPSPTTCQGIKVSTVEMSKGGMTESREKYCLRP
jgi:hypothetical protein